MNSNTPNLDQVVTKTVSTLMSSNAAMRTNLVEMFYAADKMSNDIFTTYTKINEIAASMANPADQEQMNTLLMEIAKAMALFEGVREKVRNAAMEDMETMKSMVAGLRKLD